VRYLRERRNAGCAVHVSSRVSLALGARRALARGVGATRLQFSFKSYRRTFRVPVRTSHGVWTERLGVLLRVEDETGRASFGEIAPIERFGTESLGSALAWCASSAGSAEADRLRATSRGLPCCAAAVDAMLAAAAPAPVSAPGAATTASLPVAALVPAGGGARDALTRAIDAGYTTFKLKIGTADDTSERAAVARLVERLPPGGRLRLDANGGLDTRAAARWLDAASAWPVEFVEQPLPVDAAGDLVRLAGDHATPVALDESVRDADDIKRWRDRGWRGVFVIKPALAGAADELVREVRIAPEQFVFSSALETAVGVAAGVRLAFAAGVTRALGYGTASFFEDDGLGGGIARATIAPDEPAQWNPADTWNRL
jgi:O-succinylbenzoate synthase